MPSAPWPFRRSFAALSLLAVLLVGAAPLRADTVSILDEDQEALEARLAMVLAAEKEIWVSYFIIGDDKFSLTSLSLLRDAARRGVAVRILVDAQWNKIPKALQDHLIDEGIEVREYHPFRWSRLGWIFRRMHDKLLIVDGEHLILGGRNVESPYFGFGRQLERRNYLDCDLEVHGQAAREAHDYYDALWQSRDVKKVKITRPPSERRAADASLAPHKAWLDAKIAAALDAAKSGPAFVKPTVFEVAEVHFLHDPVGKGKRLGRVRGVGHELLDRLNAAQESAVIESPYLIPSRAFRFGLRRATARGVSVRILTNSLGSTDNVLAQAAYVPWKRNLKRSGLDLWEYQGPETLHTKAAVMDSETVIVGSFNLDPRSEFLNTEVALALRDPALAAELLASFDSHLVNAHRLDHRGWPEGAQGPFPGIPSKKVFRLRLLQLIAPLIQKQI